MLLPLLAAAAVVTLQSRALNYLLRHRPLCDAATVPESELANHAKLALEARAASPWADEVPWPIFCDAVLPYCVLDEPRELWWLRQFLQSRCLPLVAGATSPGEAAMMLNSKLWGEFNVHYEPNLSPTFLSPQSVIESGRASCTGLSILLVSCCRACGVPARCAGVADWGDGSGNHVWVEVYSSGCWHSIGAAEPSELNATWFAEKLREPARRVTVLASAFRRTAEGDAAAEAEEAADGDGSLSGGEFLFPLPWRSSGDENAEVPAVDVTGEYTGASLGEQTFSCPS